MNRKIALILIPMLLASTAVLGVRFASATATLKVGVIGPYGLAQWHKEQGGMEGGAELAAMDINGAGGINIGGTSYTIQIVKANEWAYDPSTGTYDATKAKQEIDRLIYTENCKFVIGGFRTEVTDPIIEEVMDYNAAHPGQEVIFFINGASTDWLCRDFSDPANATRYKWLFRVNPINSTMLFKNVLGYVMGYLLPQKLAKMYGGVVKYGYLVEDLEWTQGIATYLEYYGLGPNATFAYGAKTPPGTTSFASYLSAAQAAGVRLLITSYTLPDAAYLISAWGSGQYNMLPVGINVWGQQGSYPTQTGGYCNYEVEMEFMGTRTPTTPQAVTFWDNFIGNFSSWPLYTAWGAYNGFIILKNALEGVGSLNAADIVTYLETHESVLLNGKGKFTENHDVYTVSYGPLWPDGYTRAMMVQWINTGKPSNSAPYTHGFVKNVVSPIDKLYSKKTKIPPWMYPLSDWDINFDGVIDVRDISTGGRAFGSVPGTSRWNIEADINLDDVIDIRDISAIGRNFGKSATTWPLP
ncbi:MAG: ABC transporter substrate-binding protein [Candidatus Bathyarchaeia archaeon]